MPGPEIPSLCGGSSQRQSDSPRPDEVSRRISPSTGAPIQEGYHQRVGADRRLTAAALASLAPAPDPAIESGRVLPISPTHTLKRGKPFGPHLSQRGGTPAKTTGGGDDAFREQMALLGIPVDLVEDEIDGGTHKARDPRAACGVIREPARITGHQESHAETIERLKDTTLDEFVCTKILSTGTFGTVRHVNLKGTRDYYAIKELSKTGLLLGDQVVHTADEIKFLLALDNPHIVQAYKIFEDKKRFYIVMQYIPGGELFSHLRGRRSFNSKQTRFYLAQMILALEYLHSRGIAYRDIKPENLLIGKDGKLYITDLGFAKFVRDRTYTLCGTEEYVSPEMITLPKQGHSTKTDMWSLGVLVYEMLHGYSPFLLTEREAITNRGKETEALYAKILLGSFRFKRGIPEKTKSLISGLLQIDPSKRLTIEQLKKHDFFSITRGTETIKFDWEKAEREECQHSLLCSPLELGEISPRDTSYFPDEPLGDNKYRSCNRDVTEEDNKALEPIRVAVKDAFDSIFVRTDPPDV